MSSREEDDRDSLPALGSVGPELERIAREAVGGETPSSEARTRRREHDRRVDDVAREMASRDAATKRSEP